MGASCRGSDISEHLLLMMMMEVSATSLLVILGVFCSAALAQPSPGERPEPSQALQAAMRCIRYGVRSMCLRYLNELYYGMNESQILEQIRTNDLVQTCGPVLNASQCVVNVIRACGVETGQSDHPAVVAALKKARVAAIVVNYICRDHVEVFNEHKACLPDKQDIADEMRQCPAIHNDACIPQGLPECVANIAEQQCGEEIANELRSLGQLVLAEAGCPARKLFKLMKKEKYSPLELMHKGFPSFF